MLVLEYFWRFCCVKGASRFGKVIWLLSVCLELLWQLMHTKRPTCDFQFYRLLVVIA